MRQLGPNNLQAYRFESALDRPRAQENIPNAYVERFGEAGARAEFARDLNRESARRGVPTLTAEGMVSGLYRSIGNIPIGTEVNMPAGEYPLPGRRVLATPGQAFNSTMSQDFAAGRNEVTIPSEVAAQVVAANPRYFRPEDARTGYNLPAGDELAYDVGYSERAQRDRFGTRIEYDEATARRTLPEVTRRIHDPRQPDLDTRNAFTAGYIQSDLDARYEYRNVDNLDGVAPGANAGASFDRNRPAPYSPTFEDLFPGQVPPAPAPAPGANAGSRYGNPSRHR